MLPREAPLSWLLSMSKQLIAFIGDLHLRWQVWQAHSRLAKDTYQALDGLVDELLALKKQRQPSQMMFVMAGDIFDRKAVDPETLHAYYKAIDRLADAGIETRAIEGNHDKSREIPIFSLDGTTTSLSRRLTKFAGMNIWGIDYTPAPKLPGALAAVPSTADCLVVHQAFRHLLGFEGAFDLSLDQVPPQIRTVLVGDIHVTDQTPLGNGGTCLSSGPLHACNLGQNDTKGFWWAEGMEGSPPTAKDWHFQEIPYHAIVVVNLSQIKMPEAASILDELGEAAKPGWKPFVKLIHASTHLEAVAELQRRYPDFVFFCQISYQGRVPMKSLADAPKYRHQTMREALPTMVDSTQRPLVFELASRCMDGSLDDFVSAYKEEKDI